MKPKRVSSKQGSSGQRSFTVGNPPEKAVYEKPAWWQIEETPSDELEAASFAKHPPMRQPSKKEIAKVNSLVPSEQKATPEKRDKYMYRGNRRPGGPFWEEGSKTTAILDLIEKNMCNFDYIDSSTLRQIEDRLRLGNIEEQLEKMQNRTWKMWQEFNDEDVASGYTDSFDSCSIPPSPDGDDIGFERELADVQENEAKPPSCDSKKDDKKQATKKKMMPLLPQNLRKIDYEENTKKTKDEEKRTKTKESKARKAKESVSNELENDNSTSGKTADLPLSSDVPPVVQINFDELDIIMNALSSMTEDDNPFSYSFSSRDKKTCVPNFVQKSLDTLKKVRHSKSESTISKTREDSLFMRQITESLSDRSTVQVNTTVFIYDYESTIHTYVAYFRRELPARECLHLYMHKIPPYFNIIKSEVVVKVTASTVSPTDTVIRKGEWWGESSPNALHLPIVPGVAFTGIIDDVDPSLERKTGLKRGDRVISLVRVGANSRHLCIDHERLVKVPSDVGNSLLLACLPEVYLAAFQALHLGQKNGGRYRKNSLAGKSILLLGGGTGTMGRALAELARAAGATTVYATGRDKEFDLIKSIGGLPLSRDPKHWLSAMIIKMDIIINVDIPYGRPELKYSHVQTLASDGRIVVIGAPDQGDRATVMLGELDLGDIGPKRKMHNYNVFDAWEEDTKQGKKDLSHLIKLFNNGSIKPQLLERIPLNKISKAHDYFETKKVTGFVLCEPWIIGSKEQHSQSNVAAVGFPEATFLQSPAAAPNSGKPSPSQLATLINGRFHTAPMPPPPQEQATTQGVPKKTPLRGGTCGTPVQKDIEGYVSFDTPRGDPTSQRRKRVLV